MLIKIILNLIFNCFTFPIVIFSPILAIKETKLSSTVLPLDIFDLFNFFNQMNKHYLFHLILLQKLIKSSFFATKSVSQLISIKDVFVYLHLLQ